MEIGKMIYKMDMELKVGQVFFFPKKKKLQYYYDV